MYINGIRKENMVIEIPEINTIPPPPVPENRNRTLIKVNPCRDKLHICLYI
jgi:hypothetical protein